MINSEMKRRKTISSHSMFVTDNKKKDIKFECDITLEPCIHNYASKSIIKNTIYVIGMYKSMEHKTFKTHSAIHLGFLTALNAYEYILKTHSTSSQ